MSKLWRGPLVILAAMNFGCGGTGSGPTTATNGDGVPQGVAGLWTDQDEEVWQLKADGTFSDDDDGTWLLDGGSITLTYGKSACAPS